MGAAEFLSLWLRVWHSSGWYGPFPKSPGHGFPVTYKEIQGLTHTCPVSRNKEIVEWSENTQAGSVQPVDALCIPGQKECFGVVGKRQ